MNSVMIRYVLLFFILALVAGGLGFGGISSTLAELAKILFFVFLVLFVITMIFSMKPPRNLP